MSRKDKLQRSRGSRAGHRGFSLLELMIAMTDLLIVGGVAMTMFRQSTDLFTDQQNTTALNISMRNAMAQVQNDAVDAADGYLNLGTTGWPVGMTITNVNPGYDTLNIIAPATTPAQLPTGTCINTSTGAGTIVTPTGLTASSYPANTQLLLVNGTNGNQMTIVMLSTATASGANMNLTFAATNTSGINTTATNDPLGITTQPFPANDPDTLADQFCQATGDWAVPLTKVTYTVNGTNQLTRQSSGGTDIIADQIIAFKVGAALFTTTSPTTSGAYTYTAGYNPRAIRSIRVSLIGRTPPGQWSGTNFANTFDGGNYKIEALSMIINPLNLSMNDCGSCN
jgi:type II secretory pathway pseudopilin PulG